MLVQKIRHTIDERFLIDPADKIAVAFSGGSDSTALLVLLRQLFPDTEAIYINHQLRDKESIEEEQHAIEFCGARNIPLHVEHLSWKKPDSQIEERARRMRYRHLAKVAAENGFTRVALAHNQDDAVETFLHNLLRGTGPAGLGGIPYIRGRYVRPLLDCSKAEILQYLAQEQILYFQDSSNQSNVFTRNQIRHKLIPFLEENFHPAARRSISRAIRWLQEQNELLEHFTRGYEKAILAENGRVQLEKSTLLGWPVPLQKWVLRELVRKLDPSLRMSSRTLQSLLRAISRSEKLELPGFLVVEFTANSIHFSRKSGLVGFIEIDVPETGVYEFPPANARLKFSLCESSLFRTEKNVAYLDAEKASFPLYIRNFRKGDYFQPLGLKGRKKVSDFFIDRKIVRQIRKSIPLVYKNDDLIWVAGYEIHDEYKVSPRTEKLLRIELIQDVQT